MGPRVLLNCRKSHADLLHWKTLIEFGTSQPISETKTELKILLDFAKIIESLSFLSLGEKKRKVFWERKLLKHRHTHKIPYNWLFTDSSSYVRFLQNLLNPLFLCQVKVWSNNYKRYFPKISVGDWAQSCLTEKLKEGILYRKARVIFTKAKPKHIPAMLKISRLLPPTALRITA